MSTLQVEVPTGEAYSGACHIRVWGLLDSMFANFMCTGDIQFNQDTVDRSWAECRRSLGPASSESLP